MAPWCMLDCGDRSSERCARTGRTMPYYALTKSSEVRTYCWAYYARGITEHDYVLYYHAFTMHGLSPLERPSKTACGGPSRRANPMGPTPTTSRRSASPRACRAPNAQLPDCPMPTYPMPNCPNAQLPQCPIAPIAQCPMPYCPVPNSPVGHHLPISGATPSSALLTMAMPTMAILTVAAHPRCDALFCPSVNVMTIAVPT
eukprot:scaffold46388_cov47-Phaeocystis_antarctica.AAC.4